MLCATLALLNLTEAHATPEKCTRALASVAGASFVELLRETEGDWESVAVEELLYSEVDQVRAEIEIDRAKQTSRYRYPFAWGSGMGITSPWRHLLRMSEILNLQPGQKFVDVGSGHGVPGCVLGALNPQAEFLGYEISDPKVQGSKRLAAKLGVENARFETADFASPDFNMAQADVYYFFNPSSSEAIDTVVAKIVEVNRGRHLTIASYYYVHIVDAFEKYALVKRTWNSRAKVELLEIDVPNN